MPYIEYPECGRIVNTHGCHGGVKIEAWCDSPAVFAALPAVYVKQNGALRAIKLQKVSVANRNFLYATMEGVDTMEAADAMRGTTLYAKREDLQIPEGSLLIAELIGLAVYDEQSGARLGTVADVIHPGATDIYVIKTPAGEGMVPVVPEFVKSVDIEKGVVIAPIEGMLP